MSMDLIENYHQFQCKICTQLITLDYNASNESKIAKLVEHQNMRHLLDFTNSELTDLDRVGFYTGNTIYIDGKPEKPFQQ